jgi:hypothetical protein
VPGIFTDQVHEGLLCGGGRVGGQSAWRFGRSLWLASCTTRYMYLFSPHYQIDSEDSYPQSVSVSKQCSCHQ